MYMWQNSIQLGLEAKESFEALPVESRMLGINIRRELKLSKTFEAEIRDFFMMMTTGY